MMECWNARSCDRPTFTQLRAVFDRMLSSQKDNPYIQFSINTSHPYYNLFPTELISGADEDAEDSQELCCCDEAVLAPGSVNERAPTSFTLPLEATTQPQANSEPISHNIIMANPYVHTPTAAVPCGGKRMFELPSSCDAISELAGSGSSVRLLQQGESPRPPSFYPEHEA